MPSSLDVTLNPFFNRRNVLLGVLEIFSDIGRLAARNEAVRGRFARLGVDGPAAVLDTGREMVRATVGFGILQVQVFGTSGGVVAKESVVRVKS